VRNADKPTVGRNRPVPTPPRYSILQQSRWAAARLLFYTYLAFSIGTLGLGGFLTGPVMTWYFYRDWRFWRRWDSAKRLYPHAFRMLWYLLQGRNGGFMLAVPLNAPPHSSVDRSRVEMQPTWEFGSSCGPCTRCCSKIHCPVLDQATGLCGGYNSFFWRYFNCGRYPSEQREIDYYLCNKWQMKEPPPERRPQPGIAMPEPEELVA
jgi:hypothetical protein